MNISMIKLVLRGFHWNGFATPSTAKKLRSVEAKIGAVRKITFSRGFVGWRSRSL